MYYFVFDAETDGLYGEAFAIAAVVMDSDGNVLDRFCEKCVAPGITDPWVTENCLPLLYDIPDCDSRVTLREHFWSFYMKWRETCVIVADVPYPVEAQLLRVCVETNPSERTWLGPYPLIDVASVLFAHGLDPHLDRISFSGHSGEQHNPLDDAIASGKTLLKLITKR